MFCPHCKVDDSKCIPNSVFKNVEYHGDNNFNIQCNSCNKMVKVFVERVVRVVAIMKSNVKDSDFGN